LHDLGDQPLEVWILVQLLLQPASHTRGGDREHLVAQVAPAALLELPGVVLGEAFLSFLGLGINPPNASWGSLAQDGYNQYLSHPYIIVIPSIAIAWLILTAFFIADGLRDALDPRTQGAA